MYLLEPSQNYSHTEGLVFPLFLSVKLVEVLGCHAEFFSNFFCLCGHIEMEIYNVGFIFFYL